MDYLALLIGIVNENKRAAETWEKWEKAHGGKDTRMSDFHKRIVADAEQQIREIKNA